MKVSNWLTAGRRSKKMDTATVNIHCNPSGSLGSCSWGDYVQFTIYSKEKGKFIRLEMTVEEAEQLRAKFNEGMKKFEKDTN
jgi:hypothetical protein